MKDFNLHESIKLREEKDSFFVSHEEAWRDCSDDDLSRRLNYFFKFPKTPSPNP